MLCGDTTVFTLHNPMKVVGIGQEKGRCWEYLPFMTSSVSEAEEIMMSEDFDFLELFRTPHHAIAADVIEKERSNAKRLRAGFGVPQKETSCEGTRFSVAAVR